MPHFATAHHARLWTIAAAVIFAASLAAGGYVKEPANPGEAAAARHSAAIVDAQASIARQAREAERRIRRALQTEVTLTFKEKSLQETLGELAGKAGVPLWLDETALENEGITINSRVSADLVGVSVETALERILGRLGLAWYVEHEVLKVTTQTDADERLSTEVYDVSELLRLAAEAERELSGADLGAEEVTPIQFEGAAGSGGYFYPAHPPYFYPDPSFDLDEETIDTQGPGHWLIDLLFDMTSGGWQLTDGVGGSVHLLHGTLVVQQTQRVHREIAGLLDALTRAAKGELAHGSQIVHPQGSAPEKIGPIYEALAKKGNAAFKNEGLLSVLNSLGQEFRVPLFVDVVALSEEGIPEDEPVSLNVQDATLNSILNLLLEPLDLTAIVRLGALEITTHTEAGEHFLTAVYDVRDLAQSGIAPEKLIDLVWDMTSGEWGQIDGTGGEAAVPFAGVLVVRNTSQVQEEIPLMLADLRRSKWNGAAEAKKPRDPQKVTTQLYRIDLQAPIEQVTDAIHMFVAGELEDNSDTLTITRVGGTLMIRTTNRGHAAIRKCLRLLRQAEADPYSAAPGGVYGPGDFENADHGSVGGGFFSMKP